MFPSKISFEVAQPNYESPKVKNLHLSIMPFLCERYQQVRKWKVEITRHCNKKYLHNKTEQMATQIPQNGSTVCYVPKR